MALSADSIGPVEYLVVEFPGSRFKGDIMPALQDLIDREIIRVVDLVFLSKDEDGSVTVTELEQLLGDEYQAFNHFQDLIMALLNDEDLEIIGESLTPGSSAAVLVWEDTWATRLSEALAGADARIVEMQRVPREIVLAAVAAVEAAEEVIEEAIEEAIVEEALEEALIEEAVAEEAVEESERGA